MRHEDAVNNNHAQVDLTSSVRSWHTSSCLVSCSASCLLGDCQEASLVQET